MNPLVEEIVNVIVNRVSEQVLAKINESLDEKIKGLIPAAIHPANLDSFTEIQQNLIKEIAGRMAKESIDDLDIDHKVEEAIENELSNNLEDKVQEIIRDMNFTIDVR